MKGREGKEKGGHTLSVGEASDEELARAASLPCRRRDAAWREGGRASRGAERERERERVEKRRLGTSVLTCSVGLTWCWAETARERETWKIGYFARREAHEKPTNQDESGPGQPNG